MATLVPPSLGSSPEAAPSDHGAKRQKRVRLAVTYVILILISLFFLAPLAWMVSTSLKQPNEYFTQDIRWIPKEPTLEHYRTLLDPTSQAPVRRWLVNSLLVSTMATILTLTLDALAGYAYARMEFPGRKVLFNILLLTLFLPGIMFLIPNYITIYRLGLLNKYAGVIAPGLAGVFGVFFMRQFFLTLPNELEEAARIDGANQFQVFYRVMLPLAKPALATLAVITFLASWNDFLWPLLVLNDPERQVLSVGLQTLQGAFISEYGTVMAGAVIAAAPVILLYIFLQRYIVQSVAMTGLKG